MKIPSAYFIVLTLSCYIVACSAAKNIEQTKPFPVGDYRYTSYDKSGDKVVEGQVSITSVESRRIQSGESSKGLALTKAGIKNRSGRGRFRRVVGSILKERVTRLNRIL